MKNNNNKPKIINILHWGQIYTFKQLKFSKPPDPVSRGRARSLKLFRKGKRGQSHLDLGGNFVPKDRHWDREGTSPGSCKMILLEWWDLDYANPLKSYFKWNQRYTSIGIKTTHCFAVGFNENQIVMVWIICHIQWQKSI